jgi:hypothetical protein
MTINSKKIWIAGLAAVVLLAGAFFLLPKGSHNSDAVAGPVHPVTAEQTTAPDQWKIVPADALAPSDVRWAPLTGDGSN